MNSNPPYRRKILSLLADQFMIMYIIKSKLDTINYIKTGYDTRVPILGNNRFLIYTAQTFYKSLIIDFAALFGTSKDHKNNFHLLKQYRDEINIVTMKTLSNILKQYNPEKDPVKRIIKLRNTEIAHYDPVIVENDISNEQKEERVSISFNWEHIDVLNQLYKISWDILMLVTKAVDPDRGYMEGGSSNLRSLQKLIKDAQKSATQNQF